MGATGVRRTWSGVVTWLLRMETPAVILHVLLQGNQTYLIGRPSQTHTQMQPHTQPQMQPQMQMQTQPQPQRRYRRNNDLSALNPVMLHTMTSFDTP